MRWSSFPLSYFPEHFCFEKEMDFQVESEAAVQLLELWERCLIVIYNDPSFFSKQSISPTSSPHPRSTSEAGIFTGLYSSLSYLHHHQ